MTFRLTPKDAMMNANSPIIYRVLFSLLAYFGATTTLEIAWTFSDIANALMAIPNLICLLALSNVVKKELERYQVILKTERK